MNKWEQEAEEADLEHKKLLEELGKTDESADGKTPEGEAPNGEGEPAPGEGTPKEDKKPDDGAAPPDTKTEDEKLQAEHTKLLAAHSVLQGKYNAEVPRMAEEIAALKKESETLKASGPAKAPEKPIKGEISKRLADEYGEDFVSDIKELLMEDLKAEINAEIKPVKDKMEGVTTSQAATAKERFIKDLTEACAEWKDIKSDPKFSAFLSGVEPFSGRTRYDLAKEANDSGDGNRVATFYNAFKSSPLYKKPAAPPAPPKKDKEKFLTPNAKGGGSEPEDKPDKKIYSRRDVDEFYRTLPAKRRQNLISEADAKNLDKEYELAELEGRIR